MTIPSQMMPGQIANTEFQCRPVIHVDAGSTRGQFVFNLAGTPNLADQPYTLTYTRVADGYSWSVPGMLLLTRRQQTLATAAQALIRNLNNYQDVRASANGVAITLRSKSNGVSVSFAWNAPATLTVDTPVATAATAPRVYAPGTVVGFSIDPATGEKTLAPIGSNNFSALNAGVIVRPLVATRNPVDNITYDVMTQGTVWMRLGGNAPLVPATAQMQLGDNRGASEGVLAVGGLTAATFILVDLTSVTGNVTRFNPLDKNIQPGQMFRMELK